MGLNHRPPDWESGALPRDHRPPLCFKPEMKDLFYEQVYSVIRDMISTQSICSYLGDFNASVVEHSGTMNINEQLLQLCVYHNLCIANTFFETKPRQNVSWKHPWSHHWHQLDLVVSRRISRNSVLITHNFHNVDLDSDHALVCSRVKFRPEKI